MKWKSILVFLFVGMFLVSFVSAFGYGNIGNQFKTININTTSTTVNNTYVNEVNNSLATWIGNTFATIASAFSKKGDGIYLYNDSDTMYFNESLLNDTIDDRATSTGDGSTNASYLAKIDFTTGWDANWSILDYDKWMYNMSDGATNSSYMTSITNKSYLTSDGFNDNFSAKTTDDLTEGASNLYDNQTFDEALTNTLYRDAEWNNLTGIPHATPSDGDITHFSLADEIYDWVVGLNYITNAVNNLVNYFTKTETVNMIDGNRSLIQGQMNANDTAIWNQNETWSSITNDSYMTEMDYSNIALTNISETFDASITIAENITSVEGIYFEQDPTNHKMFDNATCIIMTGDTARLEIC